MIDEYNANLNFKEKLRTIRKRNIDKIIVAHLNINSFRNKFNSLISQITGSIDILMISETKLDETFLIDQFIIEGFSVLYRADQNGNGAEIMLFVREDIPSNFFL